MEQTHNLVRCLCVEVTSRLVGEYYDRVVDDGACYRHTLLLTAGQLIRSVEHSVGEPHHLEGMFSALATLARRDAVVIYQRQLHVLERGGTCQKVIRLEHETYLTISYVRQVVLAAFLHGDAVDEIFTRRWSVEAAQDVEQR